MTKMHHECPKHPKILENKQNIAKKTQKYHWNLRNNQYTLETSENDQNTPKLSQKYTRFSRLWVYFGRFQIFLLILEDFRAFFSI